MTTRLGPETTAHTVSIEDLARMQLPIGAGGLLLGSSTAGPVAVRLFRSRPTQIAIAGSTYLGRLLAFRALAVGASVEVVSPDATGWTPLLDLEPAGSVVLRPAGRVDVTGGPDRTEFGRPVLRCEEVPPAAFTARADLIGHRTRAVVCPDAGPSEMPSLRAFDLALVHRPGDECLPALQRCFGLSDDLFAELERSGPDEALLLAGGTARVISLSLTTIELSLLGTPTN